jgi:hypothetical protein
MFDGKIDGVITIKTDLQTGIREELGLTVEDCQKLSSIWAQILEEANSSIEQSNSKSIVGEIITLSKNCWNKIVQLVNKNPGKNIKTDEASEYNNNLELGNSVICQFNDENPDAKSSTFYDTVSRYLEQYGQDSTKLKELKSNPKFADLAQYIEDYQSGKISIEELEQTATNLDNNGNNNINCGDRAKIIQNQFSKTNTRCEIIGLMALDGAEWREDENGKYLWMPRGEHAFCVIGLDENADTTDPTTWGENAVIVDAWLGKTFSVKDGIEYYREFFRYNKSQDNPEYKMSFGTQEQVWEEIQRIRENV